jgi:hypothetical protein
MFHTSCLSIFKNETMNLKLWLDHYLWQGIEHFYLIDNGSDDNPLIILQEYIDNGIVTYYFLPEKYKQVEHYRYVFDTERLKEKTFWLVVCDLDEFFYGVDKKLTTKIKSLENYYDYILCNWQLFGTDGCIQHPPDIRTAITHRENTLHIGTKYIIDTKFIFKPSVIENSSQIWIHNLISIPKTIRRRIANNLIRLNHYQIQSVEFFQKVKMTRGDVSNINWKNIRDMNYFIAYDSKSKETNDETLKNLLLNPPINYLL